MPNSDLAKMLRLVIKEELKPVNIRLELLEKEQQEFRKEVKIRLDTLDKGQKKLQRDVTLIRKELKEAWKDIGNFDNKIVALEKMVIRK